MRPAPQLGASLDTGFITGLGAVGERMLILADIDRLLTAQDMQLFDQTAA
jgi:purine-binding chemotaxis protein CheW